MSKNTNSAYLSTKKSYTKKWLSYEEQYEFLCKKGMLFTNYPKEKALKKLEFIGYYRLSGYSHAFRKEKNVSEFINGTQFKDIIELYKFDRKLKLLLLDAIERIEVALRACMAYQMSKESVMFLNNNSNFNLNKIITKWNNRNKKIKNGEIPKDITVEFVLNNLKRRVLEKLKQRKSEPAIDHLLKKYKEPYPLWIVIQIFDFSDLCLLYKIIETELAKNICKKFGVKSPAIFSTWIQSIRAIRNICAHHSRLINKKLNIQLSIPNSIDDFQWIALWDNVTQIDKTNIFANIAILHHMLNTIEASRSWDDRIIKLLSEFPKIETERFDSVEKVLGCPRNWKEIKFL